MGALHETAVVAVTVLSLHTLANAQDFVASVEGPNNSSLLEPHIAAGRSSALIVAIKGLGATAPFRYGIVQQVNGIWESDFTEGNTPLALDPDSPLFDDWEINGLADPSVAYNSSNGNYVCVALTFLNKINNPNTARPAIAYSHYTVSTNQWSPWVDLESFLGVQKMDKPFLVAGATNEFYVVWWYTQGALPELQGKYAYRRSTDGGNTWTGGLVRDWTDNLEGPPPPPPGPPAIEGFFAMQPRP